MYMRNSSKKRKYLIVKLFGTRSCDGFLYVCSCRYNGCINRRDVHIRDVLPCWKELGKILSFPRASIISIPELFTYALYIVIAFVLEVIYLLLSLCCLYCLA